MSDVAARLASVAELFARDAAAVDRASTLPHEHLDALADVGLYGAFAPTTEGGLELNLAELSDAVEQLAAACLASTFVWIQHFRLLAAALDPQVRPTLLTQRRAIVEGQIKGGVAQVGLMPGPAKLTASANPRGWTLKGEAPWVSGWGVVDTLLVAARGPKDSVVNVLLDAQEQPGLRAVAQHLSAMNASATVKLSFESLEVQSEQLLGEVPYDPDHERPEGLRVNGSLALGIIRRCCTLLGPTSLDDELRDRRRALADADATSMPVARARACELAVRAAHALSVQRGSSSVITGDLAERTSREAALLLTFGSRPAIRATLLRAFTATST